MIESPSHRFRAPEESPRPLEKRCHPRDEVSPCPRSSCWPSPGGSLRPRVIRASPRAPLRPAAAAEPWEGEPFSATPAALAAAAAKVPGEEGDDAVVLLADASYHLDETGRESYTQRVVYRVLTTAAQESWSTFEESWEPWHQERPVVRARVITADGVEHPLDPVTLTESSQTPDDPDMFEDGKVLRAPLPAIRPGAVVEQMVTVRDNSPFFAGGVVRQHGFDLGVLVRHSRLALDAPEGIPLRWVSRGVPGMTPREAVENGRRRLTFEVRDLEPAEEAEPGLPPEVPRTAYVAFSTGRSWEDLARRYSEIVDQAIRGSDVAAFLRTAGGPAASQLETIDRLLARMSDEVRYTGIELGEGGLIPRKPAETLKRRFGDCKDKAVLLTALLRALDIPAYVALLNAGDDEADVEPSLPGLGLFDHAIVAVPGSPAIWIDPTDPYVRPASCRPPTRARLALIASNTAAGLVKTPESTSAENRQSESREFFLAGYGPSRVVSTSEYHGAVERDLRALYAGQDGPTLRQALREYAAAAYLSGDLTAVEHSQPANLAAPLVLRMEIKNVRRGYTEERNAAVGLNPAALLTHLPDEITGGAAGAAAPAGNGKEKEGEKLEPRRGDYVFSRPLAAELRYRIVPPAGYVPQPLPAARTRHLGTATLSEEYAVDAAGVVTATLRLDTGKRRISPAEFDALRAGVRAALQEKGTRLIFDQAGELHLAAGRVREALAEFAREAAQEPRQALPHTRSARALLAGGMGEAAREEARQAVRLEPKSALAWRALGRVLEHDEPRPPLRPRLRPRRRPGRPAQGERARPPGRGRAQRPRRPARARPPRPALHGGRRPRRRHRRVPGAQEGARHGRRHGRGSRGRREPARRPRALRPLRRGARAGGGAAGLAGGRRPLAGRRRGHRRRRGRHPRRGPSLRRQSPPRRRPALGRPTPGAGAPLPRGGGADRARRPPVGRRRRPARAGRPAAPDAAARGAAADGAAGDAGDARPAAGGPHRGPAPRLHTPRRPLLP